MTTLLFKGSLSLNVHRTDSHGRPVFKKLEDSLFKPRVLNVSPSSCVSRISAKLGCFTQSTMNTLSRCSRTNPVWKPFREQTPGFNSISVRQAVNVVHVPYLLICVHFPRRQSLVHSKVNAFGRCDSKTPTPTICQPPPLPSPQTPNKN